MLLNTLLLALRSIRRNLLRSFLTILGIVIGVSAVITMVTLGNGATLAIQNQIAGLGTNLLQIRPGQRMGPGSGGAPSFREADGAAIATQIGGIAAVAPEARSGGTLVANGRNWTSSIIGSTNAWLTTGNWQLSTGREFSDDELRAGSAVCLIGETIRRELFGALPAEGAALRVRQISCTVIGVLASKGQGAFGNDQDDVVLVPLKTLQRRLTGNLRVNTLLVSMMDDSDPTRVKSSLTQLLRERRKLADGRHFVGDHQGADHAAGRGGGREPAGGRYWHHEYHAGERDRAHARNWFAARHWCTGARGAAAIPN
jgi:putative ABC transport system permease protein